MYHLLYDFSNTLMPWRSWGKGYISNKKRCGYLYSLSVEITNDICFHVYIFLIYKVFTTCYFFASPHSPTPTHTHTPKLGRKITIQSSLFTLWRIYFVLFRVLAMVRWVSIGTDIDVALMNVSWALKSLENIEWLIIL